MIGRWIVLVLTGAIVAGPVNALTLKQAIAFAQQGDPVLLAAGANVGASIGRAVQARSALLPQLSISANTNRNWREYTTRNSLIPVSEDNYSSKAAQLNLNYAVWRRANWYAGWQSESAVAQVSHQYAAAEQDLLVRLAQAWFDLMQARDAVVHAEGQSAFAKKQWEQLAYAGQIGLASIPAAEEAHYKFEQAQAEQFVAEGDAEVKLAALEQIIGPQPRFNPPALTADFVAVRRPDGSLDNWLSRADEQSPQILAARDALESAGYEVGKQRAGYEPTVELVGNLGGNGQGAGSFPGQNGYDIKQRSIGVQITIPIFSGGNVSGKMTEAVALREKARHDLELAQRNVRTATKQAWFGWRAGEAHLNASQQALKFSALSLEAMRSGLENQLKSDLDVLQARQQHLAALRDLQKARYEMITSHFKLLASTGRLSVDEVGAVDAWMTDDSQAALPLGQQLLPGSPAGAASTGSR